MDLVRKKMLEKNDQSAKLFRMWDIDKNSCVDVTEIRHGLTKLELGLPHVALARIAHVIGHSGGNEKGVLDFPSFCNIFKPSGEHAVDRVGAPQVLVTSFLPSSPLTSLPLLVQIPSMSVPVPLCGLFPSPNPLAAACDHVGCAR